MSYTSPEHNNDTPKRAPRRIRKRNPKALRRQLLIFIVLVAVVCAGVYALQKTFGASSLPPETDAAANNLLPSSGPATPPKNEKPVLKVSDAEPRKTGFYTFLICATDEDELRTDAIVVAALDCENATLNLLNVPRDTLSNVHRNVRKINSAYAVGGIDQLKLELDMLLGIPIDRYMVMNFQVFSDLVDIVGGVTFDVPMKMEYDDPAQDLSIRLSPGVQELDGDKARQLLRFRINNDGTGYADGDIGRIKTQQAFIKALFQKLLTPASILKIPAISETVAQNTTTDISAGEVLKLATHAFKVFSEDALSMALLPGDAKDIYEPKLGLDQSYYIPDQEEILELVNDRFNPRLAPVDSLDIITE